MASDPVPHGRSMEFIADAEATRSTSTFLFSIFRSGFMLIRFSETSRTIEYSLNIHL
jgi:hypothetical protein